MNAPHAESPPGGGTSGGKTRGGFRIVFGVQPGTFVWFTQSRMLNVQTP